MLLAGLVASVLIALGVGVIDADRAPPASCGRPGYERYYAGHAVVQLPLTLADRQCTRADGSQPGQDETTFTYGRCATDACVSPVQVQTTPLCEKHSALYASGRAERLPSRRLTVAGVPAVLFETEADGTILEIYTGRTTISVYGRDRAEVLSLASKLRQPVDENVPALGETLRAFADDPGLGVRRLAPPDPTVLRSTTPC